MDVFGGRWRLGDVDHVCCLVIGSGCEFFFSSTEEEK